MDRAALGTASDMAALHESGRSLAHKLFQHEMNGRLLSAEHARSTAALAAAEAALGALEAENRRLAGERDGLERAVDGLRAEAEAARERAAALEAVVEAAAASLRPYGLDRGAFRRRVAAVAARTPGAGPEAARHAVLLAAARRIAGP